MNWWQTKRKRSNQRHCETIQLSYFAFIFGKRIRLSCLTHFIAEFCFDFVHSFVFRRICLFLPASLASWCCLTSKYFGRSSPAIISFCVNRRSGDVAWIDSNATWGKTGIVSSTVVETKSIETKIRKKKKIYNAI